MPRFSKLTKNEPRYALTNMDIDFVSLCGRGINPLANVAFAKAEKDDPDLEPFLKMSPTASEVHSNKPMGDDEEDDDESASTRLHTHTVKHSTVHKQGDTHMPDFELPEGTPPEVASYVVALEKSLVDIEDQLTEAQAALEGTLAKASDETSEADKIEALIAKAEPEVAAVLRSQAEQIRKAEKAAEEAAEIAKAERDRIAKAEAVAKAEAYSPLGFETEDVAGVLFDLRKADADLADQVEQMLDSANVAVEKGGLFDEVGRTGVRKTGDSIEAAVAEIKKAQPELTDAQAEAKAWEQAGAYSDYLSSKES